MKNSNVKGLSATVLTGTFIISFCGLVYELIISTVASYLLGASVFHFSITIGLFLCFMGVGAFFSKFINHELEKHLVRVETIIGLFGGLSALLLFLSFTYTEYFYLVYFLLVSVISICTGLEIPLATRIIEKNQKFKDALANVMAFDYVGALIGAIIFPLVLLPYLGLVLTSILVGILNLIVASIFLHLFWKTKAVSLKELTIIFVSFLVLTGVFISEKPISTTLENNLYQDEIIHREQSPYQKIVLTRFKDDIRLYLDGNLQFSSIDEHRYHETLVHAPFSFVKNSENILIIGGGDGLAAREVLKYNSVKNITLIDLDESITELGKNSKVLLDLNENSLNNPKVKVINADAFKKLEEINELFDLVIIDLPDPGNYSVGKLYTKEFYNLVLRKLSYEGVLITQASSPYYARKAFWSIESTLSSVFDHTQPINVNIPSFGHWGLVMASQKSFDNPIINEDIKLQYLDDSSLEKSFHFDADMSKIETEINTLQSQETVQYYEASLENWQ